MKKQIGVTLVLILVVIVVAVMIVRVNANRLPDDLTPLQQDIYRVIQEHHSDGIGFNQLTSQFNNWSIAHINALSRLRGERLVQEVYLTEGDGLYHLCCYLDVNGMVLGANAAGTPPIEVEVFRVTATPTP